MFCCSSDFFRPSGQKELRDGKLEAGRTFLFRVWARECSSDRGILYQWDVQSYFDAVVIQECVGNKFRIACLDECVERVVNNEMVYTCCLSRLMGWCIVGQFFALNSGVGKSS